MGVLNGYVLFYERRIHLTDRELAERFQLSSEERDIFLQYIKNKYTKKKTPEPNEALLRTWRSYLAADIPPADLLNHFILQKYPMVFRQPKEISIEIYPSFAGEIPVITFGSDTDFERFVINAVHCGIWTDSVKKQGASFIFSRKNRYIALSRKPYSGVSAQRMSLEESTWREQSMQIRRQHECAHYYTLRNYGLARNNLHDELMGDFSGIYAVLGRFDAKWFRRFMGIGEQESGRLSLYTVNLPDTVVRAIAKTAELCAYTLETWSLSESCAALSPTERIDRLCSLGISGMADG